MTDADALRRYVAAADPDAFAELVGRYEQLVFGVCVRRLGCSADADDAAQQTFMKLARAASGIRGSVAAWLHTTATRTAIDLGRQKTTRRRHEAQAAAYHDHEVSHRRNAVDADAISAAGFDPAASAAWKEMSHFLDEAVLELPTMQRRLVVEVYFRGRSQREVAEEFGRSQARVCRQLQEAIASLRTLLSKRGVYMPVGALAASLMVVESATAAPSAVASAEFIKIGITGYGVPLETLAETGVGGLGTGAGSVAGSALAHPVVVGLGLLAAVSLTLALCGAFGIGPFKGDASSGAGGPAVVAPDAP